MEKSYFLWITFFGYLLTDSDTYLTMHTKDNFVPERHKNWNNLDHKFCGFSWRNRIIGGTTEPFGKFPWVVRIGKMKFSRNGGHHLSFPCGGAILNRYFVLTAAHCFQNKSSLPSLVRVGEYNIKSKRTCVEDYCAPPVQDIRILEFNTPRYFIPYKVENDLALLELEKPIKFSEAVLPICLPPFAISRSNLTGKSAVVAGWGITNIRSRKTATVLKSVTLEIVNNTWCNRYKIYHLRFPFNIICAGNEAGKDSCGGDSGGPLMLGTYEGGVSRYYIVGVVSYGPEACGETDSPGVYTYVPQFEHWLLNLLTRK
ncbi:melanization protease 1 [Halyomorpha halys]|uniref:melanization protease 1 n=1 Tax=Halyomorpha halys TaxID=286706 RepID=UPI0006D5076A|nr:melanization protease 1-like [Halyomorpha halys]